MIDFWSGPERSAAVWTIAPTCWYRPMDREIRNIPSVMVSRSVWTLRDGDRSPEKPPAGGPATAATATTSQTHRRPQMGGLRTTRPRLGAAETVRRLRVRPLLLIAMRESLRYFLSNRATMMES